MQGEQDLLPALAVVLGASALTSVLSQKLRQPVVLGYIVAGIVIGPHVPIPLVADPGLVHTLSELGVVLLMFSLGLEFSLRKLLRVGPAVAVTAVLQCSILMSLGFAVGRAFDWSTRESIFTGAIIAISSTTIIAKAFEEQGIKGKLRELVVGILIVEDLIAILLMASLTAIASGAGLSPASLVKTTARLGTFLVALVGVGFLVVPPAVRKVTSLGKPEVTIVASMGLCFGTALLARELGYSVALGAFIAGSLIAESGREKTIEHLTQPVRDVFAAVFFVSVGMMMDPALILRYWLPIVVLTVVVVVGKVVSVSLGAFLTGNGARTSIQTGMSLAQIGEFSFIIAALGLSLKATGDFLYPVAVAVSAITTLLTPWLIRASGPVARFVDRKLPQPLQTFAALYGSWLERLRSAGSRSRAALNVRRLVRMLLLDAAVLAAIIVATALGQGPLATYVVAKGLVSAQVARIGVIVLAAAIAAPFCVGIVRVGRRLGAAIADMALPAGKDSALDLAAAPRRALVVTLQLGILLLVVAPLVAITQPFLPGFQGAELLLVILLVLGFLAWRTARNLQGHVRAAAQVIVEALGQRGQPAPNTQGGAVIAPPTPLDAIVQGLGEPVAIELGAESPAIGRTLADLNLRGVTGATVLAITRADDVILIPSSREWLTAGDVLAVAGTREAVDAARTLLTGAPESAGPVKRRGHPAH